MRSEITSQHEAAWADQVERYKGLMREHRGAQAAVGRYLGVDRQTIHRWLATHRAMPQFVAIAIDRLFHSGAADWHQVEGSIDRSTWPDASGDFVAGPTQPNLSFVFHTTDDGISASKHAAGRERERAA